MKFSRHARKNSHAFDLSEGLFGWHVRRSAQHLAGRRHAALNVGLSGEAEVGDAAECDRVPT